MTSARAGGHDAWMWHVGAARITRVLEIEVPAPRELLAIGEDPDALVERNTWAQPHFVSPEGLAVFALAATCVEIGDARVVVDPCISFDARMQGPSAIDQAVAFLDGAMPAAGWDPGTVDLVVNTHVDGVGWNTRPQEQGDGSRSAFPNARHVWSATEIETVSAEGRPDAEALQLLLDAGRVEAVDPPCDLTEGVRIVPSAGHTAGNVDVWIESDGDDAVVAGDAILSPLQAADPGWAGLDAFPERAAELRRELLARCAERGTLLIGPHFGSPGAGRVVADGDAWRINAEGG